MAAFERFQDDHGAGWRVLWDGGTGYARFVAGGNIPVAGPPSLPEVAAEMALAVIGANRPLFGTLPEHLEVRQVRELATASEKTAVNFDQVYRRIPVYGASVSMLFLPDGRLTAIDSRTVPIPPGFDHRPVVTAVEAVEAAEWAFFEAAGEWPEGVESPELVVYPWTGGGGARVPRLAWVVDAGETDGLDLDDDPIRWRYFVAADGEAPRILDRHDLAHSADISGTVRGWASPGLLPDTSANPEALAPLARLTVQASGLGSTETDASGGFVFPNAVSSTAVSGGLQGPYCAVTNLAGSDATASSTFTPGVPGTLTFNASKAQYTTAEVNAYRWVLTVREYIKGVDPSITWPDFQVDARVNETGVFCNGFFVGSFIIFREAGSGCVNSAYSTFVVHEYGHWLNVIAGSGNGADGFGEGAADAWAVYVTDQPIIFEDFFGAGTFIRTAENLRQFCGDGNGGCYGQVHADGEVLMGALWKVRKNLKLFQAGGGDRADELFIGWFDAYDQQQIQSVIELQWLTLDDDDGDLSNGTPRFAPIDAAFRLQGFPGEEGLATCYGDEDSTGLAMGTSAFPYPGVEACVGPLLPGGTIVLDAGTYDETPVLDKPMTLEASGGTVRIGG